MARYWIDADVFIQSKNGLYSFELAPPFWVFLDKQVEAGTIRSSTKIYDELLKREDKKDKLAQWIKHRRTGGMFVEPAEEVQEIYRQIADHTSDKYSKRRAKVAEFLSGGDGWIIAHAKHDGGTVVSHETRTDPSALKPKIPNVCTQFGVPCIDLAVMLSTLKFKFVA